MRSPSLFELAELCNAVYDNADETAFRNGPNQFLTPEMVRARVGFQPAPKQSLLVTSTDYSTGKGGSVDDFVRWQRRQKWWNRLGFYASLYSRASDGQLVLAFRGTDELLDGLVDD